MLFANPSYQDLAGRLARAYREAEPFPHVVIDDFLPPDVAELLLQRFPAPDAIDWIEFDRVVDKKLATNDDTQMDAALRSVLLEFNTAGMTRFLERLTGIDGLIGDPYFEGGGLHQITSGGFLKVHADFNFHAKLGLDRRVNLLVYLNKSWRDDYRGHLELWDRGMTECKQRILPVFNRCVIFNTTSDSYHGHPEPLACPEGWTRKSLALYYYTSGRAGAREAGAHNTIYKPEPGALAAGGRLKRGLAALLRKVATTAELPSRVLHKGARYVEFR